MDVEVPLNHTLLCVYEISHCRMKRTDLHFGIIYLGWYTESSIYVMVWAYVSLILRKLNHYANGIIADQIQFAWSSIG